MADMSNQMKLLISAFMVLLLGVILIRPIADDIAKVSDSSISINNETLSFITLTTAIINESIIMLNDSNNNLSGTLNFDNLTILTEIRNVSAQVITGSCNVTFRTGGVVCNFTGYPAELFYDYTYISGRTETLANDEIISVSAMRNGTSPSASILAACNVTLSTGGLICDNTHHSVGLIDYTYTPDTFVRSSAARTILTLTILFFALLVLAVGIGFAIKSMKDAGLM